MGYRAAAKKLPKLLQRNEPQKFCVLVRILDNKGKDITLGGFFTEEKETMLAELREAIRVVEGL